MERFSHPSDLLVLVTLVHIFKDTAIMIHQYLSTNIMNQCECDDTQIGWCHPVTHRIRH